MATPLRATEEQPPVTFNRAGARLYTRTTWRMQVFAFLVELPEFATLGVMHHGFGGNVLTGPFYCIYDPTKGSPPYKVTGSMSAEIFAKTYRAGERPGQWVHLPWLAQEVTAQQLIGTTGMVIQDSTKGTSSLAPVKVGDWLMLYPTGYIEIIDRQTFEVQCRPATDEPVAA
jgi:hypothetical protein